MHEGHTPGMRLWCRPDKPYLVTYTSLAAVGDVLPAAAPAVRASILAIAFSLHFHSADISPPHLSATTSSGSDACESRHDR